MYLVTDVRNFWSNTTTCILIRGTNFTSKVSELKRKTKRKETKSQFIKEQSVHTFSLDLT